MNPPTILRYRSRTKQRFSELSQVRRKCGFFDAYIGYPRQLAFLFRIRKQDTRSTISKSKSSCPFSDQLIECSGCGPITLQISHHAPNKTDNWLYRPKSRASAMQGLHCLPSSILFYFSFTRIHYMGMINEYECQSVKQMFFGTWNEHTFKINVV
jgi:hypothetical protein